MTPFVYRAAHWVRGEPLAHFLAAGFVLFLLYLALAPKTGESVETISISAVQQRNIAALFEKTWGRPPTPEEQDGLVAARVREEVLAREAVAMGLGEGDTVVRTRLAQKLEFLSDDLAATLDPTDVELQRFLETHEDRYRTLERITFKQVFLKPDEGGRVDPERVDDVLRAAQSGAEVGALGDPTLLPLELTSATFAAVASTFGQNFADAIDEINTGVWTAPIASSFGVHLVLVTATEPSRLPTLSEIRETVLRDWRDAQRRKLRNAFYQDVRARYQVDIESIRDEK